MATRLPAPQRKGGILGETPDLCLYRKFFRIPAEGRSAFGCSIVVIAEQSATTKHNGDQPDGYHGTDPPPRAEDNRRVEDHEKARNVRGSSQC